MFDLFSFCWRSIPNKKMLVGYLFSSSAQAILSVASPLVAGNIINMLLENNPSMRLIADMCLLLAFCCILAAVFNYLSSILYTYLQADSSFELELQAVSHIQRLTPSFFVGYDPAYWRKRLNDDTNGISLFFLMSATKVLENGATFIAMVVILAILNPLLSIASILLTFFAGSIYQFFKKKSYDSSLTFQDELSRYSSCVQEQLTNVEFIRLHILFSRSVKMMREVFQTLRNAMYQTNKVGAQINLFTGISRGIAEALLLFVAATEVLAGTLQVGYVATALGFFTTMVTAIEYFTGFGYDYQKALVNYTRLKQLWNEPEEKHGSKSLDQTDKISFKQLSFSYPSSQVSVIQDACGEFEVGTLYGISGHNGSGKSTLLKLIAGEYFRYYGGDICYDQLHLSELDQYALRRDLIGFVEQEPAILQDTLWNNLTLLAKNKPDRRRVIELADLLGLDDFIANNDLDEVVDTHHTSLSGGEKQKIAIIRMLLKNPRVMLLDEPTSALDAVSKANLIQYLKDIRKNHLIIVVSHDQDLLAACDALYEATN